MLSRKQFANEARGFHRADHLARKNVDFARRAFANMEDSAVLLRVILHDANCEARANVNGILRRGNAEATVGAHGFKPSERHGLKIRFVQDSSVRLWNQFERVGRGPVIRIFCGAKERTGRAAMRIESGKRSVHNNESNPAQLHREFDQYFFRDLIFRSLKETPAWT